MPYSVKQTAIRLSEGLIADLNAKADDRDATCSEYVRGILESRHVSQADDTEYVPRDEFEHTELVRFAREERSLAQTREERERRREEYRRRASIVRRGWYYRLRV